MKTTTNEFILLPSGHLAPTAVDAGFRAGDRGTHTSRTIMLAELTAMLAAVAASAPRTEYLAAIVEENCLGKATASTRSLTYQRLSELYALDPVVPLFRVLRRLWDVDHQGRPLLAMLAALARDPLFAATASCIISLPNGSELIRDDLKRALQEVTGSRLNESVLDKVVRNVSSSWTQSGHLEGRVFKKRRLVKATPSTIAFALYLAHAAGFRGDGLLRSGWVVVLDCEGSAARDLAFAAKRQGLLDLRMAGDVVEITFDRLDPMPRGIANGAY
jgi:hypothetical protein